MQFGAGDPLALCDRQIVLADVHAFRADVARDLRVIVDHERDLAARVISCSIRARSSVISCTVGSLRAVE